jgi:ornithine cyclodeaminase
MSATRSMATIISESDSSRLISHESAFGAVRIAAASAAAKVFPAVIAHASAAQNTFSLKSGSTPELAGLKVGSFWPDNPAKGRPRHSSTIFLIDQDNGRIGSVIEASAANAYRTAAADAVAANALVRPKSRRGPQARSNGRAGCVGLGRTGTRSGLSRSDRSSGQKPEHVAKS